MYRAALHVQTSSLVQCVREKAAEEPAGEAYTFLADGEQEAARLTRGELDRQARAIGSLLQRMSLQQERALLLYPPGLDFIAAFFGCLYSGTIAVPAYPPSSVKMQPRLRSIVRDARPRVVLTTGALAQRAERLTSQIPELRDAAWLRTDELPAGVEEDWTEPLLGLDTLAFLQYTSGSTATPRGVMVSHGNLLHNQEMIRTAFGQSAESVIVSWLPLYHDMGLIGSVLQPLYVGGRCILMSPVAFLQRPVRWLAAISRYRATTSGGPNFAYDLCARRIAEADRDGLDLSAWSVAFNGSEPVRAATLERFSAVFAPHGFNHRAFYPCYGLAEATLFVTGGARDRPPHLRTVSAAALESDKGVDESRAGVASRTLVGCGHPWLGQDLLVVDPGTAAPCAAGQVGEIWVAGPSVAQGYWDLPEETERVFGALTPDGRGPFLRTGDLGFLHHGELFVTGRLKDLIILRGRNLYPQDIEATAEGSHPGLRPGCAAAFAVDVDGEERLIVLNEVERGARADAGAIASAIRQAVAEEHEVQAYEIVVLPPGAIPRTSSGKVQRHACRQLYLAGELPALGRSVVQEQEAPGSGLSAGAASSWRELDPDLRQPWLESYLAERLARILRQPAAAIQLDQPLTGFGLDSLTAIELQHALGADLGAAIGLEELLDGASLRELAAAVLPQLTGEDEREKPPEIPLAPLAQAGEPAEGYPLSYGQRALWFLQRLQPESAAYNIAVAVEVGPDLDAPALRRAFELLAERHEALRFRFQESPAGPRQRISPGRAIEILEEDARGWDERRLEERLQQIAYRPFDLERDPLLRIGLLRTSAHQHTVVLAVHHLVADLGSLAVLVRDLGAIYARLRSGSAVSLPAPGLRYADYVLWQQQWIEGDAGQALWSFWRQQLAGELPASGFPTDRPRPPLQTFHGAARSMRLSGDALDRVKSLGRAHRATLFSTLLAFFSVLLHRCSGEDDLLVGSPTAGRGQPGLAELVGYLVNPVVLRSDLSGRPTFDELLERVRGTVARSFAHQEMPFPLLVESLQPQRDPSRSPLFQVMFVLQGAHLAGSADLAAFALGEAGARMELAGLTVESRALEHRTAQFDLELMAAEDGRGLGLVLLYNSDLFDAATADRALRRLTVLLQGGIEDPARRIAELPLLDAVERHQLLCAWNDTETSFPQGLRFDELFARQAERTPESLAASCGERRTTYRELSLRAGRLARGLLAAGLRPEELVVVWAERGIDFLAAMLGIFEAGGAYLPVDLRQPPERLARTIQGSGARLILAAEAFLPACAAALASQAAGPPPAILPLEPLLDGPGPAVEREARAHPGQLAYILFTSGSTGVPKGVMIEHRGMINHLWAKVADLGLTAGDRVAQTASPAFDISVWQFLAALLVGGRVEILPDEVVGDPALLLSRAESLEITVLELVPALLRAMLQEAAAANPQPRLPALRWIVPTGEALPPDLCQLWLAQFPRVPLLNAYGPTECSDDVAHQVLDAAEAGMIRAAIGRPVANLRLHVLDRELGLLPAGVAGEICVGGAGVGRGYLGDAVRTAAAFVPDPYGPDPGGRLYRTGDLGSRRPAGELDFLGRLDDQVKIRGFRIEPGEVESVLAEHPAVEQAVVLARPDRRGEPRLVAYCALQQPVAAQELRELLKQRLPDAMIPTAFVLLAALPLTANGKVDRRALPEPEWPSSGPGAALGLLGLRDEVEEILADVFAAVLGLDTVGSGDDFFALGGHSLLATQVVARVRQRLGVDLPLRHLFEEPTVAGLAVRVRSLQLVRAAAPPPLEPRPRGPEAPLSFGQQRLWFLHRLEPDSPVYNMPGMVRLRGPLEVTALAAALDAIVARHESLRTTFHDDAGSPFQRIGPAVRVQLPVIDLGALPPERRESCARQLAAEESRRPFDLASGPLFRAGLVRLEEREHLLLVTLHHIVSDGWSQAILVRELSAFYGLSPGVAPALPELPIQYADFAVWQREWLEGEVLASQLAYWRRQLAGEPRPLALALDRPRPPRRTYRGARRGFRLPAAPAEALRRLSRGQESTLFMGAMALFAAGLGRHTGQDVIDIGSPIANRRFTEVEGLIGFFVNTLVLRADLGGDPSIGRLIARMREVAMGAYAHQDVPFERLVEELQPERDLSRGPLFQAMLVLQNAPAQQLEMAGLALAVEELDNGTAKFELTLSLEETGAGLEGWIEHNTDLFDGVAIERFATHLENLLEAAVERPDQPLSGLPLLTAAERHQLLAEWNDSGSAVPGGTRVHDLFAAQVERTPEAVALSFLERELTYAELDARADRLARSLRALGVGPDVPVGIFLERSLEMVIGQLAILKAGGAYLPLDPHHPARRLADIVADSGVRVVLSERRLAPSLPATDATLLLLDAGDAGDPEPPAAGLASAAVLPENLAYVLFTSGSTGRPKGVGVTHRSLVNLLLAWAREPIALGGKTLFSVTTLSFDIGSLEVLLPLVTGGKVVLVSREVAVDGSRLAAELARSQAEVMQATPATWRLLVEAGWQGARDLTVICGGEALLRELAARLRAGTKAVWNGYGPTETTIYSIIHPVGAGGGGGVPIGRPVANTVIRLLDSRLEPVPAGVIGEIFIGGAGVARGYVGRADLTAERFLPDPASEAGARLYRTGDLGRYRQDGEIEYLGRLDHQVKLRGVRIEIAEIEVALEAHPAVRQAVVKLHERSDPATGASDQRLVAYLVASGPVPEPAALRAFLAERLPEPMLPSLFVPMETLPLTPSGKVNRGALPPPDFARPELRQDLDAPRNPAEEVLAGIWAQVLGLERVGIEESFFALGGHSLLATRAMSRVNEALGVQLPLRSLFEAPTVAGLARAVAAARRQSRALPPLRRVPRDEPPRASFAQERLWVMDQLLPGNPVYNVFQAIQLRGPLDLPALARSFHEVVRRHEILRTRFATGKGGLPVQVIDPPGSLTMPWIDLSALARENQEREVSRLAREEARRPFSLRTGPLLRTSLLVLAADLRVMLLTMHHIVCDDWSVGLLVQEMAALYKAFARALPPPLADLPFQYADYACWQREWLSGEILAAELAGWKERLQGELPVLELPTDRPRPPVQTFRGAAHAFTLPAPLAGTLRELSLREGTTLFMTLLAGFAAVLHRLSGQEDVVVGAPVAGRSQRETEELIGFFVNVLPLRIGLAGRPSYRELLGRVRGVALAAYDHQDVPFEKLVEALQPKRDLGRAAIRQVGFALQDAAMRPVELGDGIVARPLETDNGVARLDLTLFLWQAEEGLRGVWEYNTDLFDAATVARFAELLQLVLADMAEGGERPLAALPALEKGASPERRRQPAPPAETDLTEAQLLFWFARKLQPEVQLYFDRATTTFTLSGELDRDDFERAFDALLGVCGVLRSRIHEVDGVPRPSVGGMGEVPEAALEHLDLSAAEAPEAVFREWLDERCRREMKLDERMFDTVLVRIGPRRFVWFFNIHHIIADAWSVRLIAHQLSHLYRLAQEGRLAEARPLPGFEGYVAEERASRQSERYLRARAYWEEKLARPVAANLFYGRPGAAVELRTERLSIELPAETAAGVGRLVAGHGLFSPAVVFAGVLFALLFRLGGERRLRIGTPFANRPERHKELVGLLMNASPMEVEIAEGETFSSLMKKLQGEIVATSRHQHYPVRNSEQQRAYDVYFNFQLISFTELCGLPVQFELHNSDYSRDHLHLQVSDFSAGGRFRLDFDFNLNLFDAAERERSLHHYLHLLAQTQTDAGGLIEDAPLLSAAERAELVAGFNSTAREYPPGPTLHELIEAQVRRSPEAIAVSADAADAADAAGGVDVPPLTYQELDRRANQLAHFLRSLGVAADSLVGVCMERSLEMVVALVGILKAGAAYVPLDPGYPAERLTYMLKDARTPVLLTQSHLAQRLPARGARVVALDTGWPEIAAFPVESPPAVATGQHLAYAIYTSGSTGKPKGAMLPHAGICNRLLWMQEAYGLTSEDRVLQKTPFSFDVSVWELFWPLITGARLVMARPGGHQDPFYLVSLIARERITTLHFVPSMLQIFLEQPGLVACDRLRRVICSGEALPDALRQRFHERLQAELHNLYGPTEASVDVTFWQCEADSALPYVPIGRPIANTQIYLLDPRLHLVPRGIPGELYIGGVSLARGYLRRPDLTAERFVPDPFGGTPGGRLYRTGDLARLQPDGAIEFLGRIDHQVKIRGFRIELGEIESVLAQFPGVREAVLLAREDRPGDRRLVAYYVPEPSWGPAPAQLRGYLQAKLPEYMVPAAFVPLQSMPLTPSGKVHRASLPPPETDAAKDESPAVAARTATESLIASICADVLGRETVGVHDNFFDLGGNSLMATQVVTMIQEILPIELDLRRVFEGPTVARLAAVIEAERQNLGDREQALMAEILLEFEQAMDGQPQQS